MRLGETVLCLIAVLLVTGCPEEVCRPGQWKKINGISIWGDPEPRTQKDFAFIESTHANWVSFQPYVVLYRDSARIQYDREDIWESSSFKGLRKYIQLAHERGTKVFIKPHLFLVEPGPDVWSGSLEFDSEEEWTDFEDSYFEFIRALAMLADSMQVEMLSVGTELGTIARLRPAYWGDLIDTVRTVYKGKLTYCANWDDYDFFVLWDKLDLIAIDAYFPTDSTQHPTLEGCRAGWKLIKQNLHELHQCHGKQILFSEFGYTSTDFCTSMPWGGHGSGEVNLVAQANAYRALFDTFWPEPWFAGGFSWLWRFDNDRAENYDNTFFTPQNKPAENIISSMYLEYK